MFESIQAQPLKVVAPKSEIRPAGREMGGVERVKAKANEWSERGKKWFIDKWEQITSKPRDVLQELDHITVPATKEDLFMVDSTEKPDQDASKLSQENDNPNVITFSKELKMAISNKRTLLSKPELIELAKKFNFEVLGSGRESVVIVNPKNDKEVIGYDFKDISPEQSERDDLVQGIMSTLFPHNYPHHQHLKNNSEDCLPITVRQRIIESNNSEVKYPYDQVRQILHKIDLPVYIGDASINFMIGEDGGEYYIDRTQLYNDVPWRLTEIVTHMKSQKNSEGRDLYSESDIEVIQNNIQRLGQLGMKVEESE